MVFCVLPLLLRLTCCVIMVTWLLLSEYIKVGLLSPLPIVAEVLGVYADGLPWEVLLERGNEERGVQLELPRMWHSGDIWAEAAKFSTARGRWLSLCRVHTCWTQPPPGYWALTKGALLCQMSLDKPGAWISFSAWSPEPREWIFHVQFLRGFPRAPGDVIIGSTPVGRIGPSPPSLHPNHCVESCYSGEAQERSLSLPSTPPAKPGDWHPLLSCPKATKDAQGLGLGLGLEDAPSSYMSLFLFFFQC